MSTKVFTMTFMIGVTIPEMSAKELAEVVFKTHHILQHLLKGEKVLIQQIPFEVADALVTNDEHEVVFEGHFPLGDELKH